MNQDARCADKEVVLALNFEIMHPMQPRLGADGLDGDNLPALRFQLFADAKLVGGNPLAAVQALETVRRGWFDRLLFPNEPDLQNPAFRSRELAGNHPAAAGLDLGARFFGNNVRRASMLNSGTMKRIFRPTTTRFSASQETCRINSASRMLSLPSGLVVRSRTRRQFSGSISLGSSPGKWAIASVPNVKNRLPARSANAVLSPICL